MRFFFCVCEESDKDQKSVYCVQKAAVSARALICQSGRIWIDMKVEIQRLMGFTAWPLWLYLGSTRHSARSLKA